jgi:oligopeptidase B
VGTDAKGDGPMTEVSSEVRPPVAKVVPHRLEAHGHVRVDEYYWLKDRDDPEVIAYLEAENAYTDAVMAPLKAFEDRLFDEIVGRIQPTDLSVPYRVDDYFYYARFEEGKEYPIHCRRRGSLEADEEVMVDVNAVAAGQSYCAVHGLTVSDGQNVLAYAVDTVGRRFYTVRFRDLATGPDLVDAIPDVTPMVAWTADNRTVFYVRQDPDTLREYQVYRHVLGTDVAEDALVFEESDEEYSCYLWRSKSKRFVFVHTAKTLCSEVRALEADQPAGTFRIIQPRAAGHEYHVEHFGDHFYIRTNDGAPNFRLMRAPVERSSREHWEELLAHRDDVLIEAIEVFRDFLVLLERRDGLVHLRVRPWDGGPEHYVDFGEPAYFAMPVNNRQFDTGVLRYVYTSMTTPNSTYDYDMVTRDRVLLKREPVLGDFDPVNYRTERTHAVAADGERVPISLVYRIDRRRPGENPLLLYGYGSYGFSMDAGFSSPRLSLLDRGFVFAIAHIRGGQELGRRWYDAGRLLAKRNTFTDFIACAEHLVAAGYADPAKLFALGGSAGGLLMGAIVNLQPDLWKGVVAMVPFVDVVTTMLDDAIPLTTGEYDEWGNPHEKAFYDYMLSYSPYDHVEAKDYPALLVTTGLHESQVQYWEPAKWVARLRATKTDDHPVLLRTNMDAGHGGKSGRFRMHRETALVYAFLLDQVGIRG